MKNNTSVIKPKKRFLQQRTPAERILYSIIFIVFAVVALFYIYIYFWCFTAGMKTHNEIVLQPFALPQNWIIGNYLEVFSFMRVAGFGYFGMLFNSIYFSVVGSLIKVMVTSIFAYTCTKYKFPGSTLVYPIIMIMLTLPIYGAQGSQYIIIKRLGLINSYSQIILAINGMNMWFLYFTATFKGVSDTYGEAAVIDGANDFQVYFKVMLPQAFNLWLAMFLMSWEADWNNYSSVLLYLPKLPTLAGGLYMFEIDAVQSVRFDMLYAAYSLSALPPLIIFAFFSNILTNSISIGGVKE